jgi:hypothetical protein
MRKTAVFSAVSAFLLGSSLLSAAPPNKPSTGSIVIVFKDGHRQSFRLADIERIEFPGAAAASSGENEPPRGRYVGKWEVGDGAGNNFTITLSENGDAYRSLRDVHGHWEYVNGDAQIVWDDGAQDAIRRVGSRYQKFAYGAGKSFTDRPDNVTFARSLTPRPI